MFSLATFRRISGGIAASTVLYPFGVLSLKLGNWDRAHHLFRQVVHHRPRHFAAHIRLGGLFLRQGNQLQALRLLNLARWIDPLRFERARLPREIHAVLGRDPLLSMHDLTIDPGRRAISRSNSTAHMNAARIPSYPAQSAEPEDFRYRDFTDREEYLRFRTLPPISPEEISEVDWTDLLNRLHHDRD